MTPPRVAPLGDSMCSAAILPKFSRENRGVFHFNQVYSSLHRHLGQWTDKILHGRNRLTYSFQAPGLKKSFLSPHVGKVIGASHVTDSLDFDDHPVATLYILEIEEAFSKVFIMQLREVT